MEGVDMNCLTETERDAILSVIRRNDQLQQAEQQRISKLQSEVKFIRLKGVIKPGQDAAKSCARCRTPFGWIFNKGTICPQCQHRICDTCRVSLEQPGKWVCVLCHKQMQLQAMTGDWFYSKFRKSKRHKRTNKVITGSEIVRTSIHRPNRPNRLSGCNTGECVADRRV
ncbi:hypothetical protein NP493_660g02019 [Ridgeia piscesae]|uniref:RabBD domain-containing protein n=1 Tax=Ridgeia piscesae TaxID=27915 RepID=A0AAD9KSH2_RIDPI|nr:hypothetical protein NP493_660g02019 [Ridgeia piscesae]